MNYFITGLPRSRTGWCAAYLTSGNHVCRHDSLAEVGSFQELPDHIGTDGVSDPWILMNWESVVNVFPEAKWVVIHRDFEECLKSATCVFPGWSEMPEEMARYHMTLMQNGLDELLVMGDREVLQLDYQNLDGKALWEFCRPDEEFSPRRLELFNKLNIVTTMINPKVTAENIASLRAEHEEFKRLRAA